MHRSVIEEVIRAKDRLLEILKEEEDIRCDLGEVWVPLKAGDAPEKVVAVDGSFNQVRTLSNVVVALTGLSILFSQGRDPEEQAIPHVDVLDRGVFREKYFSDLLSNWMRVAEIKSVLKLRPEHGTLIMMDGSFISDIINPKPTHEWINADLHEGDWEMIKGLDEELASRGDYDRIEEEFDRYNFVAWEIFSKVPPPYGKGKLYKYFKYLSLAFLLYYEHLEAIKRLVDGRWKVLFISKDSTTTDYIESSLVKCEGFHSDQILFSHATKGRGYALPIRIELSEEKYKLPHRYKDLLEIEVHQTFVRFSDTSAQTYKVEFVGVADEEIGEVLSQVAALSPSGYPIPLEKVHKDVVITNQDMEIVYTSLLPFERSVREALR